MACLRSFPCLFLAVACLLSPLLHAAAPSSVLSVAVERPDAVYAEDETVAFVVTFRTGDSEYMTRSAPIAWELLDDGWRKFQTGSIRTNAGGQARITGKLSAPGFLHCRVSLSDAGQPLFSAQATAAIAPQKIWSALPPPDEFDHFWAAQKTAVAQCPPNLRLAPVPANQSEIAAFDVQADCPGGAPVSGYLARPQNAQARALPAILTLHGAGVRSADLRTAVAHARQGRLALDINAHGLPNARPDAYYADLNQNTLSDYRSRGISSRDTHYFRGMFQRVLRAIDILAAQPEWDGRTLIAYGISQGGAQAIVAAALDERVSFLVAGFPAMCDHAGSLSERIAGWPRLVPLNKDRKPSSPAVLEASRYYDMVNFASRIKVPACFAVGFLDATCPPASIYAAYNALPASPGHRILHDITACHSTMSPETNTQLWNAIAGHISAQAAPRISQ